MRPRFARAALKTNQFVFLQTDPVHDDVMAKRNQFGLFLKTSALADHYRQSKPRLTQSRKARQVRVPLRALAPLRETLFVVPRCSPRPPRLRVRLLRFLPCFRDSAFPRLI